MGTNPIFKPRDKPCPFIRISKGYWCLFKGMAKNGLVPRTTMQHGRMTWATSVWSISCRFPYPAKFLIQNPTSANHAEVTSCIWNMGRSSMVLMRWTFVPINLRIESIFIRMYCYIQLMLMYFDPRNADLLHFKHKREEINVETCSCMNAFNRISPTLYFQSDIVG